MPLTKRDIKILKYINKHSSGVSKEKIIKKFASKHPVNEILEKLYNLGCISHNYTVPRNSSGFPIGDIELSALYFIKEPGLIELESRRWFSLQYIISHIFLPIVLAIITTLITIFLEDGLSQSPKMHQAPQITQELNIQE